MAWQLEFTGLQQLYAERQAFTLGPTEPHGLTITINIPYETENAQSTDSFVDPFS